MHAVLTGAVVRGRAQVQHRGLVAQRHESVAQALGDEQRAPRLVIKLHRLPAPEAGGAYPEVDDHIDDRAAGARYVFRLAGRDIREVDTADDPAPGHRAVGLGDVHAVPDIRVELGVAEPLEKAAPLVGVDTRSEEPGAVDVECIHGATVAAGARSAAIRSRAGAGLDSQYEAAGPR